MKMLSVRHYTARFDTTLEVKEKTGDHAENTSEIAMYKTKLFA